MHAELGTTQESHYFIGRWNTQKLSKAILPIIFVFIKIHNNYVPVDFSLLLNKTTELLFFFKKGRKICNS